MKEVARDMNLTAPSEMDIQSVLMELDNDGDHTVDNEEFYNMIMLILSKMLESEQDIIEKLLVEQEGEAGLVEKHRLKIKKFFSCFILNSMHEEKYKRYLMKVWL